MSFARLLRCRRCLREYPLKVLFVCEYCFSALEVVYDYEALSKKISKGKIASGPPNLWRYKDLLPVGCEVVDLGAGFTPLVKAKNLAEILGLKELYLKNDCLNPTYSFKDRVMAVAATKAREFGFTTLACASTGNLAGSVAAYASRAGLKAYIFIPADLEIGKIRGAAIYNPKLVAVKGNYDQVNRLCVEIADRYPWAFVNINLRPYYSEGSKTLVYEVVEQLGWRAPDNIIVPVASGSLLIKLWKGIKELFLLGLAQEKPVKIYAVQAEGCSPIVQAFVNGSKAVHPVKPKTIAKSLAIGNPADGNYVLSVLRESGGVAVAVPEEEIVEGVKILAKTEGIFAETAGGVVISGLRRLVLSGYIKPEETTVALITGAGFKTLEVVEGHIIKPLVIEPKMEAFEEALNEEEG